MHPSRPTLPNSAGGSPPAIISPEIGAQGKPLPHPMRESLSGSVPAASGDGLGPAGSVPYPRGSSAVEWPRNNSRPSRSHSTITAQKASGSFKISTWIAAQDFIRVMAGGV